MQRITFVTTNSSKLDQAKEVLGDHFDIVPLELDVDELGLSSEKNSQLKFEAVKESRHHGGLILADDYEVNLPIQIQDILSIDQIQEIADEMGLRANQIKELPFPGIFAHRVLRYFPDPRKLLEAIQRKSISNRVVAKVSITFGDKLKKTTLNHRTDLLLHPELIQGEGVWFWNQITQTEDGEVCYGQKWNTQTSPRARVLTKLKEKLSST